MTGDASFLAAIFGTCVCSAPFWNGTCAPDTDRYGGIVLWFLIMAYMFKALGTICDEYFVPALEVIVRRLEISNDVAGATFMAAGSSAPELFTSLVATFLIPSEAGVGTIIGSAIFNILVIVGVTSIVASKDQDLPIWWYPLSRDCAFYCVAILELFAFLYDEEVFWWEALILMLSYFGYCLYMKFNAAIVSRFNFEEFTDVGQLDAETFPDATPKSAASDDAPRLRLASSENACDAPPGPPSICVTSQATGQSNQPSSSPVGALLTPPDAAVTPQKPSPGGIAASTPASSAKSEASPADDPDSRYRASTSGLSCGTLPVRGLSGTLSPSWALKPIGADSSFLVPEKLGELKASTASGRKLEIAGLPQVGERVFADHDCVFTDLGDFAMRSGACYVRPCSEDKDAGPADPPMWTLRAPVAVDAYLNVWGVGLPAPAQGAAEPSTGSSCAWLKAEAAGWERCSMKGAARDGCAPGIVYRQREPSRDVHVPGSAGSGHGDLCLFLEATSRDPPTEPCAEDECAKKALVVRDPLNVLWDCSMPDPEKCWALFALSIFWIGMCTYLMVDATDRLGCNLRIPRFAMGLIFLAAGTSIPDALGSIAVAKDGEGDMAVANALGSNVFDIMLGLGVPWLIKTGLMGRTVTFPGAFDSLVEGIVILVVVLGLFVAALVLSRWRLTKQMGYTLLSFYCVYVLYNLIKVYFVEDPGDEEH